MGDAEKEYMTVDNLGIIDSLGKQAEQGVKWSDGNNRCKHCGDRMFWSEDWKAWICSSWLYMEGGCPYD